MTVTAARWRNTTVSALALAAVALAAPQPVLAITRYVDNSGTDQALSGPHSGCADPNLPCKTIGFALGQAIPQGDDIKVGGGNYSESLAPSVDIVGGVNFKPPATQGSTVVENGPSATKPAITLSFPIRIAHLIVHSNYQPVLVKAAATIEDDTFNQGAAPSAGAVVQIDPGAGSPRIAGNTFLDPSPASAWTGVNNKSTGEPVIQGNQFAGVSLALKLDSGTVDVRGNDIAGAGSVGVLIAGNARATLTENKIRGPNTNFGVSLGTPNPVALHRNVVRQTTRAIALGNGTGAGITLDGDLIVKNDVGLISQADANNGGGVSVHNATIVDNTQDISMNNRNLALDSSVFGGIALSGHVNCDIAFSASTKPDPPACGSYATGIAPAFANPGAYDYHLTAGSPLIDAGNPAQPAAGDVDFEGESRALDGNGDCRATRDIGADEAPAVPPATSCDPASPPPPPDQEIPLASKLRLSPVKLVAASKGLSVAAKRKKAGAKVIYALSEDAQMTFRVERVAQGRRMGKSCVKATKQNRNAKRCTRWAAMKGSFTHAGKAGKNKFRFTGRVNGKKLGRGSYRLLGVPRDPAGNVGKTVKARFEVVG